MSRSINIRDDAERYPLEKLTGKTRNGIMPDVGRSGRVPPQAVNVEQTVLGAMMTDQEQAAVAMDLLKPDVFYLAKHHYIFEAMQVLYVQGIPIDITTLTDSLRHRMNFDDIGGAYYLTELVTSLSDTVNTAYHCRILLEKKLKRDQIRVGQDLVNKGYSESDDAFDTMTEIEQALYDIDIKERRRIVRPRHVLNDVFDRFKRAEARQGITGLSTGFERLDAITHGFEGGEDIIVGADTSQGKTSFALSIVHHLSIKGDIPGLYLTAEMRPEELTERLLFIQGQVDAEQAKSGRLTQRDWDRLNKARSVVEQSSLLIQPFIGSTIEDLRYSIRRHVRYTGIEYAVLDYLQKVEGKGMGEQNIATVSDTVKQCALDNNIPVIALTQLTLPPGLKNKRPQREHIRGSKSIANDADLVLLIYRPEEYGIEYDEDLERYTKGLAEIRVAKQRNGMRGPAILLTWLSQYATFKDGAPLNIQHTEAPF